ncbi:MAG: PaaX family transcriptional regulator C-terminal domain-containing protein [Acidimicrobiales bacterium]
MVDGTVARPVRPRSGPSAKALLLTILGEFVLPNGAAVWTATLIRGLDLLGVVEANARQAATRLAEDGVLQPRRVGRATQWELTDAGRQLLISGAERIYHHGETTPPWNRQWLLVLAAVPEDQRAKRVALRTRLAFEGFGFLGGGVAISPHTERHRDVEAILSDLGLDPAPLIFTAAQVADVPDEQLIRRAWDLDHLTARYAAFLERFGGSDPAGPEEHFAAVVGLVHDWRRFPFEDPGIPEELLPPGWSGHLAKERFDRCRQRWSDQAQQWYQRCEQSVGPT